MERPPKIEINQFQLARLLNEQRKQFFDEVIATSVFCVQCGDTCTKGITINKIFLTDLNDILIQGTCNLCKGKVARMFEFGLEKAFNDEAMEFRNP